MALKIYDTLAPQGDYPAVKAESVEMPDGSRLSDFKGGVTSVNGQTGDVVIEIPEGASITVDSELSETSENPVQNKVVTENFNGAMQILQNNVIPHLLPVVGAEDLGKVLAVVNGEWTPMLLTIPTDEHINSLIDAKLGVIENGSY